MRDRGADALGLLDLFHHAGEEEAEPARADFHAEAIARWAPAQGGAVLAAGCSLGWTAIPLARRGALDLLCEEDADLRAELRRRLDAAGIRVPVVESLGEAAARGPFRAVLLLESLALRPQFPAQLPAIAAAVQPGGLVLADWWNAPGQYDLASAPRRYRRKADDGAQAWITERLSLDGFAGVYALSLSSVEERPDGRRFLSREERYRLASPREVERDFETAGFEIVARCADHAFEGADAGAEHLQVAARRRAG